MDGYTFVSKLVDALVWPGIILFVGFKFRDEFSAILKSITKFKGPGFELERDLQQAKEIADQQKIPEVQVPQKRRIENSQGVNEIADSPIGAVLASWVQIETQLKLLNPSDRGFRPQLPPETPPSLVALFDRLRLIRNKVAHGDQTVTEAEAREFVTLAQRLLAALQEINDPTKEVRQEQFATTDQLIEQIKAKSAAIAEVLVPRTSHLKFTKHGEKPRVTQDVGAILRMIDGTTRLLHIDDAEVLLNDGVLNQMNIPIHFMRD